MKKVAASEKVVRSTISMMENIVHKPFAVMGIVNVTPDSFFDGGSYLSISQAVDHACRLADQGVDIIDIGGQSTRPGAALIDWQEECDRIAPVIEAVAKKVTTPVSVDTFRSRTAAAALDAGARIINDISAGRLDHEMPAFAARRKCPIILMHSRESPATMQNNPAYRDVVADVKSELLANVALFLCAGVDAADIVIDPGIGFAKRFEDNRALLCHIGELVSTGYPVCVGTSRKAFIGQLTGKGPEGRLVGSLASITAAFYAGAKIFRVHDVEETIQFLTVLHALYG
jgi:dihydropteroate synthase